MTVPQFGERRLSVYERHFGKLSQLHPAKPEDYAQVSVLEFAPSEGRDFITLVTSGMSDRRMHLSDQIPEQERPEFYRRELVWYVSQARKEYIGWMQWLGWFPFIDKTWLGHGHTIQWHEPLFPGSDLRHFLLTYSVIHSDDQIRDELEIEGDSVGLLWINPITSQEWRHKKEMRIAGLLDLFEKHKHPLVFDPSRSSYA